ncbi:MAG: DUF3996 domain-containing protein [Treponema sp.]|nr:DUF3996 domain-containing protein [Treponema sp.]
MKKKLVLIVTLAALMTVGAAGNLFAESPVHPGGWGIGAIWGSDVGGERGYRSTNNLAFSLKIPDVPIFWALDLSVTSDWTRIGVQGDYYLAGGFFVSDILGWFLGIGFYGNFMFGNDIGAVGFGARLPIGLTFQPIDILEVFLNIAPRLGGTFWTTGHHDGFRFPDDRGFFGFELGLRLWF